MPMVVRDRSSVARLVTGVGVLLGSLGVATLLGLHLLPRFGGVDPVHDLVSEYPLREYEIGVPYALALLSMNAAAVILAFAMVRHGMVRERLARALLVVWCVSLLGLTVFLKDPAGSPATWYGVVHMLCTTVMSVCVPALCGLVWWRFRSHPYWRARARTVVVLGCVSVACMIPFVVAFATRTGADRFAGMAIGLFERGMIVVDVAVMLVLALWTRELATTEPSATRAEVGLSGAGCRLP